MSRTPTASRVRFLQREKERVSSGRFPLHELVSKVQLTRTGEVIYQPADEQTILAIRASVVGVAEESKSKRADIFLRQISGAAKT